MVFSDYGALDGLGLAGLIQSGAVRPEEVLEAAIARIDALNPKLNAVVRTLYDEACRQIHGGLADGPFKGVPFLLKDLSAHYAGVPTAAGSALFAELTPSRHSPLTERYLAAGLVVIGKSNTPELGLSGTTESQAAGACRNPWDPARSPGGSSGGSAAAVAAGMVPMAHGTDTGGSIRNPASNCGLFGFKPTRNRVPMGQASSETDRGLSVMHAVTRTVRDSAALLDVSSGSKPKNEGRTSIKHPPLIEAVGREPGPLKIAFHTHAHHRVAVHPECLQAVAHTARLCEDLGHIVEEGRPEIDGDRAIGITRVLWAVDVARIVSRAYRSLRRPEDGSGLEWITWQLACEGKRISALDWVEAAETLDRLASKITPFFDRYDVVLSPVLSRPAWPLGIYENSYADTRAYVETVFEYSPFCWPYNFSGQPAMSLPMHWTPAGLPVGVQFAGRYDDDARLFALAAQLEAAQPWIHRKPPDP